jgi:hypothetical protein
MLVPASVDFAQAPVFHIFNPLESATRARVFHAQCLPSSLVDGTARTQTVVSAQLQVTLAIVAPVDGESVVRIAMDT